jgi:phage terminase large subunit-like protein
MEVSRTDVGRSAAEALERAIQTVSRATWRPLPHQIPPQGDWYGWLLLAGRGAGKTDTCAKYVVDHVNGPPCIPGPTPHWVGIIAPTLGDAATACFSGPSGIKAHDDTARMGSFKGGLAIHWPNGSVAKLFGARSPDDVDRLRAGGNRCLVWAEEMAAWRYLEDCWDQMRFGLRSGKRPHWIGSTTPKPRVLIKRLDKGEIRSTVITRATTYDNPHLPSHIKGDLEETYGGTALGAQELLGRVVEQDENALWKRENLERDRVKSAEVPPLTRVTVGVDPSGGRGEQGIVVVGKHDIIHQPTDTEVAAFASPLSPGAPLAWQAAAKNVRKETHGYVIGDYTCRLPPDGWGRRVVEAAVETEADDIVVETNFGGDMAIAVIEGAIDHMGVSIPVKRVTASRGKHVRAQPVAAMSARGKWHMAGEYEELEDQLCTWTEEADYSPDRLDAMVWPAWHQKMVRARALQSVGAWGGQAMNQKIG